MIDKAKKAATQKRWRDSHKEQIAEYQRQRPDRAKYFKKYRADNGERIRRNQAIYRNADNPKAKAARSAYYAWAIGDSE